MIGIIFLFFGGLAAYQLEVETGAISSWLKRAGYFPPQPDPNTNTGGTGSITERDVSIYPHSNADLDALARTIWGEARSEGYAGMQAVANVIMNRFKSPRWPNTVRGVALQNKQFSAWNSNDPNRALMEAATINTPYFAQALQIARLALTGQLPDITGGADHYLNVEETKRQRGGTLPSWVDFNKKTAAIGQHTFMRLV